MNGDVLPFRFLRRGDRVLITSLAGEHTWLTTSDFTRLVKGKIEADDPVRPELESIQVLGGSSSALARHLLAVKLRTRAAWMAEFTRLHLFIVTLRCNQSCPYCQVSRAAEACDSRFDMAPADAMRAIDLMFDSPARHLTIEFQGGEPTLRFDLVRLVVDEVERRNVVEGRRIRFVLASNATDLSADVLAYMRDHGMVLSTSLDGPADLHNANRPYQSRRTSCHADVLRNLDNARNALGERAVSALMTTTRKSLDRAEDIVAEYRRVGLRSVFARSLSPFGFAARGGKPYSMGEFLVFYQSLLSAVIGANRQGYAMTEVFARLLARRILTHFPTGYVDLQSPTGAVLGAMVYNYDGDVYPSDEARMLAEAGDTSLRLGNVRDDYTALVDGPVARALVDASIHASMPGCTDCALSPWCGADPVYHWATQGDPVGRRPESDFCRKHMATILHVLDLLDGPDPFTRRLLVGWATAEERGE